MSYSAYVIMNGWREILARTFDGFIHQENVSPPWLVNPATSRRLKLDHYYPDAGIAVRFVGLTAKGQGRQSDWEVMEEEQRDQTRAELCRLNSVQLCLVDPAGDVVQQLDNLLLTLTRASRLLAQSKRTSADKQQWMPQLSEARSRATALRGRAHKDPEQTMATLADSWRDREANLAGQSPPPTTLDKPPSPRARRRPAFRVGQRVAHTRFGQGVITGIAGQGEEETLSILFDGDAPRQLLSQLVMDKLEVLD